MTISLISLDDTITIIYNKKHYVISTDSLNSEKLFKVVKLINKSPDYHDVLLPIFERFIVEDLAIDVQKYKRKHNEKLLSNLKCVEFKDNKICLKNLNFYLPDEFITELKNAQNQIEVNALVNFMYNLADNPFPDVRNRFFDYIKHNTLRLTPNGLVIMYRKVDIKSDVENVDLKVFLSSQYLKIKAQKKSPKNYTVFILEDNYGIFDFFSVNKPKFKYEDIEVLGNLHQMYNDSEKLVFTDNYTGKMNIKLLNKIKIPIDECDTDSDKKCSKGLHLSNYSWFKTNTFGTTGLMCLINPSDIVAIPLDNYPKIRTCAYYPVAVIDNKTIDEIEAIDLKVWDLDYFQINFTDKINKLINETALFNQLETVTNIKSFTKNEILSILNNRLLID